LLIAEESHPSLHLLCPTTKLAHAPPFPGKVGAGGKRLKQFALSSIKNQQSAISNQKSKISNQMPATHIQLTAKYRPQNFAQVVGQEEICTVLSRAAALDRIAAAYLFSGTRGVGKTTIARIFAKAVNCQTAPTPEPCNYCRHCRQITSGSAVDVAEIDGASNRGIEQARRLKEDVGYAPLEGRYKIIIIDEAHMLTKEAFNALLKTLEEPPPGVTFVMATTEPQKFPATIVSRCQHFVFKRLTQTQLEAHLRHVLEQEGRPFEPAATVLLARRAAGSVRDGMSLLEQVLTIGDGVLRLEDVRRVLGLAGGELFQRLITAIRAQDCVAVSDVLRVLLDQGLDLGFFLRELVELWRNLFLLRQAGEKALTILELPDAEARIWLAEAAAFSPTYIHAAWQITLEGQRQVLTSLEPAQALEMLLLNLTYLPQLLPLERLADSRAEGGRHESGISVSAVQARPKPTTPPRPLSASTGSGTASPIPTPKAVPSSGTQYSESAGLTGSVSEMSGMTGASGAPETAEASKNPLPALASAASAASANMQPGPAPVATTNDSTFSKLNPPLEMPTWASFLEHYDALCKKSEACLPGLRQVNADLQGKELTLRCLTSFQYEGLQAPQKWRSLEHLLREYFGPALQIKLLPPLQSDGKTQRRPNSGNDGEQLDHPLVREFAERFQAKVISLEPWGQVYTLDNGKIRQGTPSSMAEP
jgi:DNA polymerase-3 subunit gamma/tau